jgi:glycosyltransferase involved in cell wall biosynthesis
MLHIIPIEPYDRRYTEQWNRWFPEYLGHTQIPHKIIWGEMTNLDLNESDVLDIFGTHLYKYSQLSQIVNLIKNGELTDLDILFFHTLWFTGIDSLQYIRQSLGKKFKITGVLHAGSYDPWDFRTRYGMRSWALPLENAWLTLTDRILVATEYHKNLLLSSIVIDPNKVVVTKLPLKLSEIQEGRDSVEKEDIIAFPHRMVPEKDPELVDRIKQYLPGVQILRTRDYCTSKQDYYNLLARCKICVSNSYQETFGYSMLEAAALGCIPLVPDRLCYPEMYPDEYRFRTEEELVMKISYFLDNWSDPRIIMKDILNECNTAIERMIQLVLDCI